MVEQAHAAGRHDVYVGHCAVAIDEPDERPPGYPFHAGRFWIAQRRFDRGAQRGLKTRVGTRRRGTNAGAGAGSAGAAFGAGAVFGAGGGVTGFGDAARALAPGPSAASA